MKRAWDQVKLTILGWDGDKPEASDELHTGTGRRYLILNASEKKLTCLVLPRDEPMTAGRVFQWEWGKRTKGQGRRS